MLSLISKFILEYLFGWKLISELPKCNKGILFCYPHTSYIDGFYALLIGFYINAYLLFKRESFAYYIALLFRHYTVDRNNSKSQTDLLAEYIMNSENDHLLAMSPEGSTHYNEFIKSGFYHIALKADIPIICGNMNFNTREYSFSNEIYIKYNDNGTVRIKTIVEVMNEIRKWYTDNNLLDSGLYPNKMNPLRVKSEM